jgi:hypothetical protein
MSEDQAENLHTVITQRTQEHWDKTGEPYLLSRLGPDLLSQEIDYPSIIKPYKMRPYIEFHMADVVKVISHPTQKQKIGIIPASKNYKFDEESNKNNISAPGGYKIPSELWAAFTTPLKQGHNRYVSISGSNIDVQDTQDNSPSPDNYYHLQDDLIVTHNGSKKTATEVFKNFEQWSKNNNIKGDAIISPKNFPANDRKAPYISPEKLQHLLDLMASLNDQEKDLVNIPVKILLKMISK